MKTLGICSTIVVIGFIILCLVTTKSNSNPKELPNVEQPAWVEETEKEPVECQIIRLKSRTSGFLYRISKVEFSGHTYIVVEDQGTAILHDPDCKCNHSN